MNKSNVLKKNLRPGHVYRRQDLEQYSNSVDRHLKQLQAEGTLTKLSGGFYHYPKKTAFGEAPADDKTLVEGFLKDKRFLVISPNAYNALAIPFEETGEISQAELSLALSQEISDVGNELVIVRRRVLGRYQERQVEYPQSVAVIAGGHRM